MELRSGWGAPFVAGQFFFFQDLADQSSRDAVILCDRRQTVTASSIMQHTSTIDLRWTTADPDAFELGAPHAGPHSLDDQIAFQFCNRRGDDDDGTAQRAARVHLFAAGDKLNAEMIEFVQHFEEMFHRAGHAIAGPDR